MGKVGIFLYNGFQEMEFWYPMLRMREMGAEVVAIGVDGPDAAVSVLGYPVVPNVAMADTPAEDYAALIVPGGDVKALAGNATFAQFLRDAQRGGARLAAASQAAALVPDARVAKTTDDVPQMTRALLEELSP